jgi:hypothetical protein
MNHLRVHAASSDGALRAALPSRSVVASLITSENTADTQVRRRCASPHSGPWLRWHVNGLAIRVNLLGLAVAALCFSLLAPPALAQQANALNGEWLATYQTKNGGERQALVTIADDGGTWQDVAKDMSDQGKKGRRNPCVGRNFALSVTERSGGGIKISVNASDVIQGCANHQFKLKEVDGNTLEGTTGDGRTIKLVRR